MEDWKIHKDRSRCERPGCPLSSGGEYFAVLELPACTRRDLCEPCFRELENDTDEAPLFWRGRPRSSGSKGPVLDLVSLRLLFDRLGDPTASAGGEEEGENAEASADTSDVGSRDAAADDDAEAKAETARGLRYLVALLLLRKRKLKMVSAQTPEQEAADLVVIDPKVEEMEPVALHAPELDSERFASLKDELMAAIQEGA